MLRREICIRRVRSAERRSSSRLLLAINGEDEWTEVSIRHPAHLSRITVADEDELPEGMHAVYDGKRGAAMKESRSENKSDGGLGRKRRGLGWKRNF